MGVDIGFGELFDRIEKHVGKLPTKILVGTAWFAAMAILISTIWTYLIGPILKVGPSISSALTLIEFVRIAGTIFIFAGAGSWALDAYRIRHMRGEIEDTTAKASRILDEMRSDQVVTSEEARALIVEAKEVLQNAIETSENAENAKAAALLLAERFIELAKAGKSIPVDDIPLLEEMLAEANRPLDTSALTHRTTH